MWKLYTEKVVRTYISPNVFLADNLKVPFNYLATRTANFHIVKKCKCYHAAKKSPRQKKIFKKNKKSLQQKFSVAVVLPFSFRSRCRALTMFLDPTPTRELWHCCPSPTPPASSCRTRTLRSPRSGAGSLEREWENAHGIEVLEPHGKRTQGQDWRMKDLL